MEAEQIERLGPTGTVIHYNGSGFAGDQSRPIAALLARMESDKLEDYWADCVSLAHGCAFLGKGQYADTGPIYPESPNAVRFCGNFETYSHAFAIDTDDAEVIEVLTSAIAANRARFAS